MLQKESYPNILFIVTSIVVHDNSTNHYQQPTTTKLPPTCVASFSNSTASWAAILTKLLSNIEESTMIKEAANTEYGPGAVKEIEHSN